MSRRDDKSLARSLGEFFGHVWSGVRSDPAKDAPVKETLRHEVEERTEAASGGRVTVRRTTIEEIEYQPDTGRAS